MPLLFILCNQAVNLKKGAFRAYLRQSNQSCNDWLNVSVSDGFHSV